MSLNDIIERFALVSGLGMQDVSRCLPVITDCRDYFESRLKEGLSPSQLRRAAYACAVYAWYRIGVLSHGSESGVKAGDVQFSIETDSADIAAMWENERALVADIVDLDDHFAFRSVSV